MTACDACWDDAYLRSRMLGGSQVEHYRALLVERADDSTHAVVRRSADPAIPCETPTPGGTS